MNPIRKCLKIMLLVGGVSCSYFANVFAFDSFKFTENSQAPGFQLASNDGGALVFNPRTLSWKAVNANGVVVKSGRASGGRGYCPDIGRSCRTPVGTFRVQSMGGSGCRSSLYPVGKGGAPMPYCMFFSKYYAVHGSYEVPNYNASHGCVRVPPSDALWLQRNFVRVGTKVVIKPY